MSPFLIWGTAFIKVYVGVIYTVIGPTLLGGFMVFGFLGFVGAYMFYRAFLVAFPQGNHRMYGVLVFLYPSLLYWPNGLGKDALMMLFLGLSTYGTALLMRDRSIGLLVLAIGLMGALTVRPPVAGVVVFALLGAFAIKLLMARNGNSPVIPLVALSLGVAAGLFFLVR
ncbi:MAG: hypothetical protein IIC87_07930, partial [Chloroflexi bacterium]|nr:hypothetical protein [Chloroflexota bacterium]